MIGNSDNALKIRQHTSDSVDSTSAAALASGKEAGVGATRADLQSDALGALGAVAFVCCLVAVQVNAAIDIAANEMHADKSPPGIGRFFSARVGSIAG
jgi:hypothetical protein